MGNSSSSDNGGRRGRTPPRFNGTSRRRGSASGQQRSAPKKAALTPAEAARRRELEKFCVLHGIYPSCPWTPAAIREQVVEGLLAPIRKGEGDPGEEELEEGDLEECPICFLYYRGGLNRSGCCKHSLCTECYLQIRPPGKEPAACPFCQSLSFSVAFRGPLTEDEKLQREIENLSNLQGKK